MTKGTPNVVKRKGGCHMFLRLKRCKNGLNRQKKKLSSVGLSTLYRVTVLAKEMKKRGFKVKIFYLFYYGWSTNTPNLLKYVYLRILFYEAFIIHQLFSSIIIKEIFLFTSSFSKPLPIITPTCFFLT